MGMKIKLIIVAVLMVVLVIGYIGTKIMQKKHKNDPEYEKKQQELAAEYRRKQLEDSELNDLAMNMNSTGDYSDN